MQIHPIGSSPTMTVVCEGHRRRLTPPSSLWLVCEESVARVRANVGERSIFFGRRGVEGAKEGAHIKCVTE